MSPKVNTSLKWGKVKGGIRCLHYRHLALTKWDGDVSTATDDPNSHDHQLAHHRQHRQCRLCPLSLTATFDKPTESRHVSCCDHTRVLFRSIHHKNRSWCPWPHPSSTTTTAIQLPNHSPSRHKRCNWPRGFFSLTQIMSHRFSRSRSSRKSLLLLLTHVCWLKRSR